MFILFLILKFKHKPVRIAQIFFFFASYWMKTHWRRLVKSSQVIRSRKTRWFTTTGCLTALFAAGQWNWCVMLWLLCCLKEKQVCLYNANGELLQWTEGRSPRHSCREPLWWDQSPSKERWAEKPSLCPVDAVRTAQPLDQAWALARHQKNRHLDLRPHSFQNYEK